MFCAVKSKQGVNFLMYGENTKTIAIPIFRVLPYRVIHPTVHVRTVPYAHVHVPVHVVYTYIHVYVCIRGLHPLLHVHVRCINMCIYVRVTVHVKQSKASVST